MCDWAVSWPWYTVCVSQRQPVQQLRPAMMTMGILESDDIHPRGWKASENAERDAIMMMDPSEYSMPMALPPPWYLDTRVLVKIVTTCILILLPIIIRMEIRGIKTRKENTNARVSVQAHHSGGHG